MIDRDKLESELSRDSNFRSRWRRRNLRWDASVAQDDRNAGLFRRRVIDQAMERIEAGERDAEAITEQISRSFVGSLIIGIFTRLLINAIVQFILKRVNQAEREAADG